MLLFLGLLAGSPHAGDDESAGNRVHGKAQDVVVAGFRQDLGDVALHGSFGQVQFLRDLLARWIEGGETWNSPLW